MRPFRFENGPITAIAAKGKAILFYTGRITATLKCAGAGGTVGSRYGNVAGHCPLRATNKVRRVIFVARNSICHLVTDDGLPSTIRFRR